MHNTLNKHYYVTHTQRAWQKTRYLSARTTCRIVSFFSPDHTNKINAQILSYVGWHVQNCWTQRLKTSRLLQQGKFRSRFLALHGTGKAPQSAETCCLIATDWSAWECVTHLRKTRPAEDEIRVDLCESHCQVWEIASPLSGAAIRSRLFDR